MWDRKVKGSLTETTQHDGGGGRERYYGVEDTLRKCRPLSLCAQVSLAVLSVRRARDTFLLMASTHGGFAQNNPVGKIICDFDFILPM